MKIVLESSGLAQAQFYYLCIIVLCICNSNIKKIKVRLKKSSKAFRDTNKTRKFYGDYIFHTYIFLTVFKTGLKHCYKQCFGK